MIFGSGLTCNLWERDKGYRVKTKRKGVLEEEGKEDKEEEKD